MPSSSSSPCAACKFMQCNCTQGCVFAPYFPADQQRFSNVFPVYGTIAVAKMLNRVGPEHRKDVAASLAHQADMRVIDPVYGCIGEILEIEEENRQRREILELLKLHKEIIQKRVILEVQLKLQKGTEEEIRRKSQILEVQVKFQKEIEEEIGQKSQILEVQEGIMQKRRRVLAPAADAAADRAATAPRSTVVADDDAGVSLGPCSDADEPTTTALSSSLDNY